MALSLNTRRALLVGGTAAILATIPCLIMAVANARHSVNATLCVANLAKLHFALVEYNEANGKLPPAHLCDESGNPTHSWRVLILPHLDCWGIDSERIQQAYTFDEPWDSPANRLTITPVNESRFACPCGEERNTTFTSYVAPVGVGTLFPGSNAVSLYDLPADVDPILLIEITHSDIHWTEPRDLLINDTPTTSGTNSIKLTRSHGDVIRYVTAKGRHGNVPSETNMAELRRMCQTGISTSATEQ